MTLGVMKDNSKKDQLPTPNLYEQWYRFLKLTDPDKDKWKEEVRQDFKGVFTMEFEDWFERVGSGLFSIDTYESQPVRYLLKGESLGTINLDTHFVLVIDRKQNFQLLAAKVSRYLEYETAEDQTAYINDYADARSEGKKRAERKSGAPKFKKKKAPYKIEARPDARALELVLLVDGIAREHAHEKREWPQWRIGVEANIQSKANLFCNKFLEAKTFSRTHDPSREDKDVLQAAVSRLLVRAEIIKAGVTQGKFPVTK